MHISDGASFRRCVVLILRYTPCRLLQQTGIAVCPCGSRSRRDVPVFRGRRPWNAVAVRVECAFSGPRRSCRPADDGVRVLVPVHYAGVACEMDTIMEIAKKHNLLVIEDAAQGVMSTYKGRALGSIGDYGCYSFHETKNYSMGEGGALVIRDKDNCEMAEIVREKGTNRSKFFRGQIDKYTWVEAGSSYLPSELNAAYLWAQLEIADEIFNNRMESWNLYWEGLRGLSESGKIQLPFIPNECNHNAHMFYIKAKDLDERTKLISYLKSNGINSVFHYIPLHTAPAGKKYGEFVGEDVYTTKESERLLRLPLYYGMKKIDVERVIQMLLKFFLNSHIICDAIPVLQPDIHKQESPLKYQFFSPVLLFFHSFSIKLHNSIYYSFHINFLHSIIQWKSQQTLTFFGCIYIFSHKLTIFLSCWCGM